MNPNPEQSDAPFTIDGGDGLLFIRETKNFVYVASFHSDPKSRERALITLAALNAAIALHAAGWDAARVFERLLEVMQSLEDSAYTIASLTGDDTPCAIQATGELITLIAQLKRDTAGGGR